MEILHKCERYFTPIGRIIVGAFFLLAGLNKIMDVSGTAAYIESVGLPAGTLLAIAAIIIEIGAGAALIIGYQARWAALILAGFTLIISFPFHGPQLWADQPMQQIQFMKNMAILGGLLFIAAHIEAPCCQPMKESAERQSEEPTPTL